MLICKYKDLLLKRGALCIPFKIYSWIDNRLPQVRLFADFFDKLALFVILPYVIYLRL